jgi:DNA repair protein RecN (Recombination protein N)
VLLELTISDLALIEKAALHFGSGLNVITGETGAGKSLLVDALELLLGQRARSEMVRAGAKRARVEGRFAFAVEGWGRAVADWLRENLPETLEEWEEDGEGGELELILTRTLSRDGRSRAHVNHRPVTRGLLRELAAHLVEIHGQNDHQRLFDPHEQLRLLDTFGELESQVAGYRERRDKWRGLASRLEEFDALQAERLQRIDVLRFQADELAVADPSADERGTLEEERTLLRHASELSMDLGGLVRDLGEADGAALEVVQRAERVLEVWAERLPSLGEAANAAREAAAYLAEAVQGLRTVVDAAEADPARLEEVEERLGLIERLERKYHTDVAGLVQRREVIEQELAGLRAGAGDRADLEADIAKARRSLVQSAGRLTKARSGLLSGLKSSVEKGFADLGLERACFEAHLVPCGVHDPSDQLHADRSHFAESGAEAVEFHLAANPGEPFAPLRKVASGGEMARTMLALRGALAVQQSTPTLIFDEVDAGVGGRLGPKVGTHLAALGEHHQVLCVTHLPAIAAAAAQHMRVKKAVDDGRTRTHVSSLSGADRVEEIADMIAGGAAHATARAEAQRLLEQA